MGSLMGSGNAGTKYDSQLDEQQGLLQQRASGPGIATTAYQGMANQGMGNVLAGIAQTKGLRPSAAGTMADVAGSRIQGQTAQQAGLMGLQEQQANQNSLMSLLMKRKEDAMKEQAAKNSQMKQLIGTGITAAATMYGGPMAGAAANSLVNQAQG